jgi:hypothetical protein
LVVVGKDYKSEKEDRTALRNSLTYFFLQAIGASCEGKQDLAQNITN